MQLHFNFEKTVGKIKPMHGVGQPPLGVGDDGVDDSLFHYLTEANIPYSRLHDTYGDFAANLFVDIPNLFRNFDADENDPASYDFVFTDVLLSQMMKAGVDPYWEDPLSVLTANGYTRIKGDESVVNRPDLLFKAEKFNLLDSGFHHYRDLVAVYPNVPANGADMSRDR